MAKNGVIIVTLKKGINSRGNTATAVAWLAINYSKTISNSLSDDEKEVEYQKFWKESQANFALKRFSNFDHFDRMGPGYALTNYIAAVKLVDSSGAKPVILLSPVNEPYSERNGNKLLWLFGSFAFGSALFLACLLATPLRKTSGRVIKDRIREV